LAQKQKPALELSGKFWPLCSNSLRETPCADPHAGCCGEGGLETRPYPISSSISLYEISDLTEFFSQSL